jgi:hypothetical protein
MKAEYTIDGTTIDGATFDGDKRIPRARQSNSENVLVLQDFVFAHYMTMALAHAAQDKKILKTDLFIPESMNLGELTISATGEAEVESEYLASISTKLILQFTGSGPFAIYFDKKRGLPVYMAFPQTGVEAFLDEFYKDKPVSRLRRASSG